ncbi:MAG TPA: hypothetical protein QGH84_09180 [Rhodospirillales bacterium]|jgi:flagellar biosynthesis/type III secretory pathway M-ring protein FliF/YscJ|nr:hypothetical protein [Rhodospirillales bacterium]
MPAGMEEAAVEDARFNPSVLDVEQIERRVEKGLVKRVGKLIDEFPDRTLRVVRDWMAEGY